MKSNNKKSLINLISGIAGVLVLIAAWQIAAYVIDIAFILPSPISVFKACFALLPQKSFISAVTGSMLRVFIGYLLGVAVGTALAFLAHFVYPVKAFSAPVIKIITATPIAAFILLCMLFMANESTAVFVAFLMVLPIVYGNVTVGLENTDRDLIEAVNMYGFSPFKRLAYLYIPSALPYFGSACITNIGLAWKAAVSSEILCATVNSIGYYIYFSKQWMETEVMFAYTVWVIVLSILCEYAVKGIALLVKRGVAHE